MSVVCYSFIFPPLAGETFCGIAALKLLGQLPPSTNFASFNSDFIEGITKWLVYRQTVQLYEDEEEEEDEEGDGERQDEGDSDTDENPNATSSSSSLKPQLPPFTSSNHHRRRHDPQPAPPIPTTSTDEVRSKKLLHAGFNGRSNKVADTCYAWWVGSSLGILNRLHLQNFNAAERYLLEKTQHQIGGFSKMPGDPPGE